MTAFSAIMILAASVAMPPGFTDDYEAALAQAKAERKLVLADFSGSDWCFWCQRLDNEILTKEEFVSQATNRFVLLMVDFPRDKSRLSEHASKRNPQLRRRYNVTSFPTVLLLDSDGKIVGETGFVGGGPENYLAHLEDKVKAIPSTLQWIKPLDRRINDFFRRYSREMTAAVAAAGTNEIEAAAVKVKVGNRLADELDRIVAEERQRKCPDDVRDDFMRRLDEAAESARQLRH